MAWARRHSTGQILLEIAVISVLDKSTGTEIAYIWYGETKGVGATVVPAGP